MKRTILAVSLLFSASAVVAQPASTGSGQAYPAKPIRMVVPYPPAGVADILARVISERLGQRLGQTVVVFNREGAGSAVGSDLVTEFVALIARDLSRWQTVVSAAGLRAE